jgi:hypothetical protein
MSDLYPDPASLDWPWIFLTGHEAYDWETGSAEAVAGSPEFPLYGHRAAAAKAISSSSG